MDFVKKYITTEKELVSIPVEQRHTYYLGRNLLRLKTGFKNQSEPLAGRKEIEAGGILCKPFWEDSRQESELDSEGRAFAAYLAGHPGFDVIIRAGLLPLLVAVQSSLPAHLKIVIKAGLRPVEVQAKLFEDEFRLAKAKYPSWNEKKVYDYTQEFVTDPSADIPPHSTGGAIDIHLWDARSNDYADFGSPINAVDDSSWGDNHTGLSPAQIRLRQILRDKMLEQGFVNLASEWWHFSYGDQRWALYYDKPGALYDIADIKPSKNKAA